MLGRASRDGTVVGRRGTVLRPPIGSSSSIQRNRAARLYRIPERGKTGVFPTGFPGSVDRRRSGLAIFASCAAWLGDASRANPDLCQLVGHMARAGGNAELERFIDQGRRTLFDFMG